MFLAGTERSDFDEDPDHVKRYIRSLQVLQRKLEKKLKNLESAGSDPYLAKSGVFHSFLQSPRYLNTPHLSLQIILNDFYKSDSDSESNTIPSLSLFYFLDYLESRKEMNNSLHILRFSLAAENYRKMVWRVNTGIMGETPNSHSKLKNLENFTEQDLIAEGIILNSKVVLNFENGIKVAGKLIGQIFKEEQLVLLTFSGCTVNDAEGNIYFEPAWGTFDMAVGIAIISVFNGAADKNSTEDQLYVSTERTYQQNYTAKDLIYQSLFKKIRDIRELGHSNEKLVEIWEAIKSDFKEDWLGALELLELADLLPAQEKLATEIRAYLIAQVEKHPKFSKLIIDGVSIIDAKLKFE